MATRPQRLALARRRALPDRCFHRRGDRVCPAPSQRTLLSLSRLQRAAFSVRSARRRPRDVRRLGQFHRGGAAHLCDDSMHGSRHRSRARGTRSQRHRGKHHRAFHQRQRSAIRRQGRDVQRQIQLWFRGIEIAGLRGRHPAPDGDSMARRHRWKSPNPSDGASYRLAADAAERSREAKLPEDLRIDGVGCRAASCKAKLAG